MRRADRLFQIVHVLRAARLLTAQQLADRLGVSVRTVYRDVEDLRSGGVRIEGEAGVGYRLARDHELPPLVFDAEEIEALVIGVRLATRVGDRALALAARRALDKVEAALPADLRARLQATAVFAPSMDGEGIAAFGRLPEEDTAGSTLRFALRERRRLHISYVDGAGVVSERVLWPLGLFWWGDVWSLGAWCELRQAFRVFRVDRVQRARALDEAFPDRPDRDLTALLEVKRMEGMRRGA
ncbi:MAG TPA: YafY family protein [Myxococcota bacterium]|nr:YafY family protein [Myxococcota bacterium]